MDQPEPEARAASFADAARHADVAVLAVKGTAAADAIRAAGATNLAGKAVIDATNPINGHSAPISGFSSLRVSRLCGAENGVLRF